MSAAPDHEQPRTGGLARRLRPLQVGAGLQGFMLWVPVEKLFQTQIGFDAAAIAVMAVAYAAVVPLLEVPSGILADRWSRSGILIISSAAAAVSALVGGLSHNVATYIVAALILGVYFAMNSGTVDSVVYDTVIEETGSAARCRNRRKSCSPRNWRQTEFPRCVRSVLSYMSASLGHKSCETTSPRGRQGGWKFRLREQLAGTGSCRLGFGAPVARK
jgi:hypothetical protein